MYRRDIERRRVLRRFALPNQRIRLENGIYWLFPDGCKAKQGFFRERPSSRLQSPALDGFAARAPEIIKRPYYRPKIFGTVAAAHTPPPITRPPNAHLSRDASSLEMRSFNLPISETSSVCCWRRKPTARFVSACASLRSPVACFNKSALSFSER
jgi:hypothetical protein